MALWVWHGSYVHLSILLLQVIAQAGAVRECPWGPGQTDVQGVRGRQCYCSNTPLNYTQQQNEEAIVWNQTRETMCIALGGTCAIDWQGQCHKEEDNVKMFLLLGALCVPFTLSYILFFARHCCPSNATLKKWRAYGVAKDELILQVMNAANTDIIPLFVRDRYILMYVRADYNCCHNGTVVWETLELHGEDSQLKDRLDDMKCRFENKLLTASKFIRVFIWALSILVPMSILLIGFSFSFAPEAETLEEALSETSPFNPVRLCAMFIFFVVMCPSIVVVNFSIDRYIGKFVSLHPQWGYFSTLQPSRHCLIYKWQHVSDISLDTESDGSSISMSLVDE